jgi:flagellar motor switch protein FliM
VAEVLSQAEIDVLLAALSNGSVSVEHIKQEEEEKRIRVYDFKRPNRFSKEQIRTLSMLHDNFARLLSTFLSAQLRAPARISLLSVQEMTYDEFIRSVPNPTLMAITTLKQLGGQMVVEMNPTLAFALIERLFGGKATPGAGLRPLTDIELAVLERILVRLLAVLDEAWSHVSSLKPELDRLETNPQFVQIISPSEMVALVSIKVEVDAAEGLLNLCFPYLVFKPVAAKLSAHHWFSAMEQGVSGGGKEVLSRSLARTDVPVVALLGRAGITVRELLNLQVGDVIELENRAGDEIQVLVGSRPKFLARPGQVGRHLGVQITARYKGDENGG